MASLRARNRARVRHEIQDAAWRLFTEHGFAAVTTQEIASAAGVSTSTYFRHVASKEDLLLQPMLASSADILAAYADRPAGEPAALGLAAAIRGRTAEAADTDLRRWRAAMRTAPELGSRVTLIADADRDELVRLAAERGGSGLVVHLVLAAAEYAYGRWIDPSADERSLVALIDAALDETLSGDWR